MNESIQQEEITVIKIHVPNRASKYMKHETYTVQGEVDNSAIIVGDLSNLR